MTPLSALAFAVTIGPALRRVADSQLGTPLAFADDVVLISTAPAAAEFLRAWQAALHPLTLNISPAKLAVWAPGAPEGFWHTFAALYPDARRATQGFVMCGLPVDTLDADLHDQHVPWGARPFLEAFLAEARAQLQRRLGTLTAFVDTLGPHTPALYAAVNILRVNLLPRFMHLLRFLPLTLTLPWAQVMDGDILAWLQDCLALPFPAPCWDTILRTPLALGGLPLLILADESVLHFLSGHLALHVVPDPSPDPHEQPSMDLALRLLAGVGAPDPFRHTAHLLPHRRPAHYRRALHDALMVRMHHTCPWLVPPALDAQALRAGITPRFQCRTLLAWFPARGAFLLHAAPLRFAVASHCRVPLLPAGGRCHYATHSQGGICAQALDPHVAHCWTCGFGPRQRNTTMSGMSGSASSVRAGWHATPEQLVALPDATHKRADILATADTGELFALDVTFTSPLDDSEGPLAPLHRAATAKAGRYHTTLGGTLPGGRPLCSRSPTWRPGRICTVLASPCSIASCEASRHASVPRTLACGASTSPRRPWMPPWLWPTASRSTPGAICPPVCPRSGAIFRRLAARALRTVSVDLGPSESLRVCVCVCLLFLFFFSLVLFCCFCFVFVCVCRSVFGVVCFGCTFFVS